MSDVLLGENLSRPRRAFDKLLELRDIADGAETSTASETAKAFPILKYEALDVVVFVSAIDATTGDETYVLTVEVSDTSGGTYVAIAALPNIRAAGTGVYLIPISGATALKLSASAAYIRITATLGGTTPSITYGAFIGQSC